MTSPKKALQGDFSDDPKGPIIVHLHQFDDKLSDDDEDGLELQPLTVNGYRAVKKAENDDDAVISAEYVEPTYSTWTEWLYPPHVPPECQLLRKENIAIPACYLLVGILQGLSGPWINVYPLDLGATEAQQTTLSSIRSLPASFKLLFGFVSDNFPLLGYRRKSYMLVGWLLSACSMAWLNMRSDLTLLKSEDAAGDMTVTPPEDAPEIPFLSLSILIYGTGFWLADVMGDSVVAEKAKLELPHMRGSIQSSCYSYRFFGLMCAAPLSTVLYEHMGPQVIVKLLTILPLCILPMVYNLQEVQNAPVASTKEQCGEIWTTVCSRAVWQPLGFVYLYNVLQVGNAAWREYLKTTLQFTSTQLNSIYIVSCVLLYLGVVTYKYYLMHWSWRSVYIVTTLMNGLFSFLQILLLYQITFGISNFWFAIGDDAVLEFVSGIQFLPTTIMMVHLCPSGSEGASYAMFTTVHNSALNLSTAISTRLLGIWDVSKEALMSNEVSGMVKLTILTTVLQVSGILFVKLLPHTKEDLVTLKNHAVYGTSKVGGTIFLSVTFGSIAYAIFVGILNIIAPGWMGES